MKRTKLAIAAGLQALALTGRYVVPTGPDGNYAIYIPTTCRRGRPAATERRPARHAEGPAAALSRKRRRHPDRHGAGTVTNMMTGKGASSSSIPASS